MSRKTGVMKACATCGKDFYVSAWREKTGAKFCSMQCIWTGEHKRMGPAPAGQIKQCQWCGNEFYVPPYRIETARFCSPRCTNFGTMPARELAKREALTTHGQTVVDPDNPKKRKRSPEWKTWMSIKLHCDRHTYYINHNITVCDEWKHNFPAFLNYLMETIGPKPSPQHSLDRYPDNARGYQPGNIRWATNEEQAWSKKGRVTPEATKERMRATHREQIQAGHGNSDQKLTANDIREIRRLEGIVSRKELAKRYGLNYWHVRDIQKRRCWTHVE